MASTRAWRTFVVVGIIAVPFVGAIVTKGAGEPCNKRNVGPNQACTAGWANSAFCTNWGQNACNDQQGAPDPAQNPGARFDVGCTEPTNNPANHCTTQAVNCVPKFWCAWIAGAGCVPLNPVINPDMTHSWLQENQAQVPSCVPHM